MNLQEIEDILNSCEKYNIRMLPNVTRARGKFAVVSTYNTAYEMFDELQVKNDELHQLNDVEIDNAIYDYYKNEIPPDVNDPIPEEMYDKVLNVVEEELRRNNVYSDEIMQIVEDVIYKYNSFNLDTEDRWDW